MAIPAQYHDCRQKRSRPTPLPILGHRGLPTTLYHPEETRPSVWWCSGTCRTGPNELRHQVGLNFLLLHTAIIDVHPWRDGFSGTPDNLYAQLVRSQDL
jgi:hypothetical protein